MLNILKKYWGYTQFRGIQQQIIESIAAGRDTLGLMPTGGGKSITFQVPALSMEGTCLVVTPLVALMKDQVQNLRRRNINAAAIFNGMSRKDIIGTLENCIFGHTKILYVSPERLASQLFIEKLKKINISFITVDEAHCISQWGYDFRPAYLRIADIRKIKPDASILALTATATSRVVEDIQEKLQFRQKNCIKMSFRRPNLAYIVRTTEDKNAQLIHILQSVNGSAIVYVRNRRDTKEVAEFLQQNNIDATFFHAGLDNAVKDQRQQDWTNSRVRVIVATNAFGMGIDKPDVRLVIHLGCPDSIEAYFQEAGRAGRDRKKAYAVLLYNKSDRTKLRRRIADNYPDIQVIKNIYEHLAYFFQIAIDTGANVTYPFDIQRFCKVYHFFPTIVDSALYILQNAGYVSYDADPDAAARVKFILTRDQLYLIHHTTPHQEAIISAMLRLYTGMFSDYVYISEANIAERAGLTQQQVYLNLKALNQLRVIHFIPQRKMPTITYTRDRVDIEYMKIPAEAYELRKKQFEENVKNIIEYAEQQYICRSQWLLNYFDEKSERCGICDICVEEHKTGRHINSDKETILQFLADQQFHHVTELLQLHLPTARLEAALRELSEEEEILAQGSKLKINL